jgi:hypothetical protein
MRSWLANVDGQAFDRWYSRGGHEAGIALSECRIAPAIGRVPMVTHLPLVPSAQSWSIAALAAGAADETFPRTPAMMAHGRRECLRLRPRH